MPLVLGSWFLSTTGVGQEPPPEPEPTPEVVAATSRGNAGAFFTARERTRAEIRRDRQRFGIIPQDVQEVIAEVAASQVARGEADEQKRFEEFERELELRRIGFEARYLEALGVMRERLIEQAQIQQQREDDELIMLLMMAAAAAQ